MNISNCHPEHPLPVTPNAVRGLLRYSIEAKNQLTFNIDFAFRPCLFFRTIARHTSLRSGRRPASTLSCRASFSCPAERSEASPFLAPPRSVPCVAPNAPLLSIRTPSLFVAPSSFFLAPRRQPRVSTLSVARASARGSP